MNILTLKIWQVNSYLKFCSVWDAMILQSKGRKIPFLVFAKWENHTTFVIYQFYNLSWPLKIKWKLLQILNWNLCLDFQMQDLYSSKFPDLFSTFSTQFYKVYPKWNITKKMSYSIKKVRIRDVIQESEVKRWKWKEKWLKGNALDSIPQRTAFCELKDRGSKRSSGDKMR